MEFSELLERPIGCFKLPHFFIVYCRYLNSRLLTCGVRPSAIKPAEKTINSDIPLIVFTAVNIASKSSAAIYARQANPKKRHMPLMSSFITLLNSIFKSLIVICNLLLIGKVCFIERLIFAPRP